MKQIEESQLTREQEIQYFLEHEFIETDVTYGWIAAHHSLRHLNIISSRAKLILFDIFTMSKKVGYCFASNHYFMDKYQVSKKTITRAFNELVKAKLIEREIDVKGHNGFKRKVFLNLSTLKEIISKDKVDSETSEVWTNKSIGMDTDVQIIRNTNNSGGYELENSKSESQKTKYGMDISDTITDDRNSNNETNEEDYAPEFDKLRTQFSEATSKNKISTVLKDTLLEDEDAGTAYGKR